MLTHTELVNRQIKLGSEHNLLDANEISDGYHTFGELYKHRITLFIALCRMTAFSMTYSSHPVWRSQAHSDGTQMKGWFLLGINKEHGKQITYHLPIAYWPECNFAETLDKSPFYDEHTSDDVLKRLAQL